MTAPATPPARPSSGSSLALGAWLALCLVLGRSSVLLGLELAHHGNVELAGLRLAHGFLPLLGVASLFALAAGLVHGAAMRAGGSLLARVLVALAVGAAAFPFLNGRLEGDPSQRIGTHTPLGSQALLLTAFAALVLAVLVFAARFRSPRARRGALVPLAFLALLALGLRVRYGGLGGSMEVRHVVHELAGEKWEVLREHEGGAVAPGVLSPSEEYRVDGAARPALVLPPPALARRVPDSADEPLWLVGGAGIDHSVEEVAGERYPGCSVRFRVRVNGASVFETSLPLADAPAWVELGEGRGIPLRGGDALEVETALTGRDGAEVEAADPLPAGFGGLALERRERRPRTRASPEQPNIVLVLIDTLRADHTSAYGYGRETTPHLAALAARGTLFEEACATASWTWPSTASILTGLQPEEHGVEDGGNSFLSAQLDTLAEALQRAGFTTAAWSGSPLIVPDKGFDQGFEFFDASREGRIRRTEVVLPGALEWLGIASEWRFFLYLHLMEPHIPYVPIAGGRERFAAEVPRDFDARAPGNYSWELLQSGFSESGERRTDSVVPPEQQAWIRDLYDGCVWSVDSYLGDLLARLEDLGLTEDTIVAVTSDHGEELFDHGLLTHSSTLHRELVRVPLVLAGPGIPRGERVSAVLSNAGLAPTLARLGGSCIEGLGERAATLDLLQPGADQTVLFSTRQGWWNGVYRQPLFGLRRGSSVLHFAPQGAPWGKHAKNGTSGKGETRLYDLARDPAEETDLASLEPERAHALLDDLLTRLAGFEARRVVTGGVVDEGTLDVLRELGYVGK